MFSTPGVYIQEITKLPASVAPVATAIPAFIGYTEIAEKDGKDLDMVPTRITSMLDYEKYFGFANKETFNVSVKDIYDGGNNKPAKFIQRTINVETLASPSPFKMYYSLKMYFENGGGPCYIVSVGKYTPPAGDSNPLPGEAKLREGLEAISKYDEPTLLVFPDIIQVPAGAPEGTTATSRFSGIYNDALAQCNLLKDRFVIMDVKDNNADIDAAAGEFRNDGIGMEYLKYGAVYYPFLTTILSYAVDETVNTVTFENVYLGTGTPNPPIPSISSPQSLQDLKAPAAGSGIDPNIYGAIMAKINEVNVVVPPGGVMAGVYARVDRERGVWKAPANVGIRSVVGPTIKISNEQQENLNVHTTGKSINAIRAFTGKGTMVWGARTLAGNDNEWRYVPVRRLFIFVEESVKKATEFVVFEPNDANTWIRTKAMIENFLTLLWRDGALAGAKADDAFYVNVGLGLTMTAEDILNGIMNIEIGLAAVRPAEFIILKFQHKLQTS